ncbi:Chorismate mutase [Gossypium arboreum]|uniref:Chorismate mutase n=1 Tax=Gossypium arboreum TaxID=29729 RepID=A0A0B0NL87_GOSAR|nr:Chorismate mutase [Gossypium arboreum]
MIYFDYYKDDGHIKYSNSMGKRLQYLVDITQAKIEVDIPIYPKTKKALDLESTANNILRNEML